jgi:hypothetical protein
MRAPWVSTSNGGAALTKVNATCSVFLLRSATTSYGLPVESYSSNAPASNTTPDEIGGRIEIDGTRWRSARVSGVLISGDVDAENFDVVFYDGATSTVLRTFDKEQVYAPAGDGHMLWLPKSTVLIPGGEYRLTIRPATTTPLGSVHWLTVPAAGDRAAFHGPDAGATIYWTERTDAGVWTDTTTRMPAWQVLFSDVRQPDLGNRWNGGWN